MLDHLRALAVFSAVADAGSFRAAGQVLGISASVVSHHVTALETRLDTPLIYRTTRKLSLTDAGQRLARSARDMVAAAEAGFSDIVEHVNNPLGHLRITAPATLQYARFVTRTASFIRKYPKVEVTMAFTDRRLNLVEEGFDLGFRVGNLQDSSLMSRKLAEGRIHIVASPDYLNAHQPLRHPSDLERLELIHLNVVNPLVRLTQQSGKRTEVAVHVGHRISIDSGFAALRMAEEACGLVVLPDFLVRDQLTCGTLVDVLPDWHMPGYGIYATWPPNSGTNHLRRLYLDHIAAIATTTAETDRIS